ncbi:MAG: adenylate/guanylate cyclase domain-containing protein [Acidimicrobiia bacterium]|nr:adenylate/guanylate cyclase domain-containing protein [Acidimicrobiia bacterium]
MDEISYARVGDAHVAYCVSGMPGAVDVVVVSGALFPLEMLLEDRVTARFLDGLRSLGRLVVFDRRGVGLSDPLTDFSRGTQEQWAEDLLAVIDAAGLDRPMVVSWETLGTARRAASMRPDLMRCLVLINPAATTGPTHALIAAPGNPTLPTRSVEDISFPSRSHDPAFIAWLGRAGRSGASPTSAERIWELMLRERGALTPPDLTVPTLVLHNRECLVVHEGVQTVVDAIAGAELVEVEGGDMYPIAGDVDALVVEAVCFVTGTAPELTPERSVAAVLFTDFVDSTLRASAEGDRRWRDVLDTHDRAVQRFVARHGGRVVKYTGDGVLALLPSATAALDAARAILDELHELGLEIRAGVHIGDIDIRGDDVSGIMVNVTARIMAQAGEGEILVSESVRCATLGSGFRFEDTWVTDLKGVPEAWTLHRWIP